jgi:secreted trypsin-like serine protease
VYNEDGEEIEQLKRFDDESAGKVAGGSDASKNEWPWVVMLMNRGRQFCDGSIIDQYHILTAAHCVAQMKASDVTTLSVRAGAHNLQNSANEAGVQNVNVKLVVKNKKFSMSTLHSDIAILVLKTPIQYTSTVKAVCLPKGKQSYEDKMGTVVGWGLLRENGPRPTVLQELTMKIWNNDKCKRTYGSTAPAGIKDTMLCAGQKGKDSCSGDSGGPFSVPNSNGRWEQVGVVSWGIGCGKEHYPGVYTRVTHMMDWIEKVRRLYPN